MMKLLVILSVIIISSNNICYSQESTEPFKKANTIIVETKNADSLNLINFSELLLSSDYFIKSTDNKNHLITTVLHALKTKPNWSYRYFYRIRFKDSNIIIVPYWTTNVTMTIGSVNIEKTDYRWHYAKGKGNIQNMIYNETLAMIKDYCECRIIFKQQGTSKNCFFLIPSFETSIHYDYLKP